MIKETTFQWAVMVLRLRTGHLLLLAIIPALLLAGCAELQGHVTVRPDGGADLVLALPLPPLPASLLTEEQLMTWMRGLLEAEGFSLEETDTDAGTTLLARKSVANAIELLQLIGYGAPQGGDAATGQGLSPTPAQSSAVGGLQIKRGLLFDSYLCRAVVDMPAWLAERLSGWQLSLANLALAETKLTMQVTMPWMAKSHNADFTVDGNRTLGWRMQFNQPRELQAQWILPSRNLVFVACGLILGLAALGVRRLRRRRW